MNFIRERENIRLRRERGKPRPWTQDPILNTYRFCNVQREHDAVTRWISDNWRTPHKDDPDVWFAMVVARHLNLPDCMKELGYPVPWEPKRFRDLMSDRRKRKDKVFSAAYMIGTGGSGYGMSKPDYLEGMVLTPLWRQRETLRLRSEDTLNSYHMLLCQMYGLASFLAAQVVADLKYIKPLSEASDWETFAASGPGSRRGMNRILDRPVKKGWREDEWRLALSRVREALIPLLQAEGLPVIHSQDIQNCLCETDKMERTRLGEGRPKRLFRSSK